MIICVIKIWPQNLHKTEQATERFLCSGELKTLFIFMACTQMCLHIKMGQCVSEGLIVGGKSGIIMLFFISEEMLSFPDNLELSNNKRVNSHHAQKTRNG